MADPRSPVEGSTNLVGWPAPEVVTFRKICVKTKEFGPEGEREPAVPPPHGSANLSSYRRCAFLHLIRGMDGLQLVYTRTQDTTTQNSSNGNIHVINYKPNYYQFHKHMSIQNIISRHLLSRGIITYVPWKWRDSIEAHSSSVNIGHYKMKRWHHNRNTGMFRSIALEDGKVSWSQMSTC